MNERQIHGRLPLIADVQPAEVSDPGDRPLDDPALSIASQLPPILRGSPDPIDPMRAYQLDGTSTETSSEGVTVVGAIGDDPFGLLPGPARSSARYGDGG